MKFDLAYVCGPINLVMWYFLSSDPRTPSWLCWGLFFTGIYGMAILAYDSFDWEMK